MDNFPAGQGDDALAKICRSEKSRIGGICRIAHYRLNIISALTKLGKSRERAIKRAE
jgi:hypothetical protein